MKKFLVSFLLALCFLALIGTVNAATMTGYDWNSSADANVVAGDSNLCSIIVDQEANNIQVCLERGDGTSNCGVVSGVDPDAVVSVDVVHITQPADGEDAIYGIIAAENGGPGDGIYTFTSDIIADVPEDTSVALQHVAATTYRWVRAAKVQNSNTIAGMFAADTGLFYGETSFLTANWETGTSVTFNEDLSDLGGYFEEGSFPSTYDASQETWFSVKKNSDSKSYVYYYSGGWQVVGSLSGTDMSLDTWYDSSGLLGTIAVIKYNDGAGNINVFAADNDTFNTTDEVTLTSTNNDLVGTQAVAVCRTCDGDPVLPGGVATRNGSNVYIDPFYIDPDRLIVNFTGSSNRITVSSNTTFTAEKNMIFLSEDPNHSLAISTNVAALAGQSVARMSIMTRGVSLSDCPSGTSIQNQIVDSNNDFTWEACGSSLPSAFIQANSNALIKVQYREGASGPYSTYYLSDMMTTASPSSGLSFDADTSGDQMYYQAGHTTSGVGFGGTYKLTLPNGSKTPYYCYSASNIGEVSINCAGVETGIGTHTYSVISSSGSDYVIEAAHSGGGEGDQAVPEFPMYGIVLVVVVVVVASFFLLRKKK